MRAKDELRPAAERLAVRQDNNLYNQYLAMIYDPAR
jgi:hypothetical protein